MLTRLILSLLTAAYSLPLVMKVSDARYPSLQNYRRIVDDQPNSDVVCVLLLTPWWQSQWQNVRIPQYILEELPRAVPVESIDANVIPLTGGRAINTNSRRLDPRSCEVTCGDTRPWSTMTMLDHSVRSVQHRDIKVGRLICPLGQEVRFGQRYSIREYDNNEELDKRPAGPGLIWTTKCWCIDVAEVRESALVTDLQESSESARQYKTRYSSIIDVIQAAGNEMIPAVPLSFEQRRKAAAALRQTDLAQFISPDLLGAENLIATRKRTIERQPGEVKPKKTPNFKRTLTSSAIQEQERRARLASDQVHERSQAWQGLLQSAVDRGKAALVQIQPQPVHQPTASVLQVDGWINWDTNDNEADSIVQETLPVTVHASVEEDGSRSARPALDEENADCWDFDLIFGHGHGT